MDKSQLICASNHFVGIIGMVARDIYSSAAILLFEVSYSFVRYAQDNIYIDKPLVQQTYL